MSAMRLVSYNILDGGVGRELTLGTVLADQRPDVVALVEADAPETAERIARRLSMDFVVAGGAAHGCALLSRFPIVESVNHGLLEPRLTRSFLEARLELADQQWVIGVLHLPAHATEAAEEQRQAELEVVLGLMEPHRAAGRPHVICGDFNSNARYQRIEILRCKPRTQRDWAANGGRLPRRVIEKMLAAGYFDTFRQFHDEEREVIGSFSTSHPGQRVDYIFGHGFDRAAVRNAWVYRDDKAADASDHFPIGVELA